MSEHMALRPDIVRERPRVTTALAGLVNLLMLNGLIVIGSALVVTLPVTVNAAMVAIHRSRRDDDDRVVHHFISAFRSTSPGHTTLVNGIPMVAVAIGAEEIHYFALKTGFMAHVCLGLGCGALLITMSAVGYVFLLNVLAPAAAAPQLWSTAVRLAIRNVVLTGPLFIAEITVAAAVCLLDPALCLIGLAAVLLHALYRTARLGLRRAHLNLGNAI